MSRETRDKIKQVMRSIQKLLLLKNKQYGDSALNPIGVFSKGDAESLIRVRIDDKLSRLARGNAAIESDMDVIDDLIGYLILLKVVMEND